MESWGDGEWLNRSGKNLSMYEIILHNSRSAHYIDMGQCVLNGLFFFHHKLMRSKDMELYLYI